MHLFIILNLNNIIDFSSVAPIEYGRNDKQILYNLMKLMGK